MTFPWADSDDYVCADPVPREWTGSENWGLFTTTAGCKSTPHCWVLFSTT